MNIGLQPQYPTMWWIDGILAGIVLLGLLIEYLLDRRHKKRVSKDQAQFEEDHQEWEQQRNAHEVALRQRPNEVEYWYKPEPSFRTYPSSKEQTPVGMVISLLAGVALLITGLATVIMCVPFNSKYFSYYTTTGRVAQVQPAVDLGSDTVSSDFVVALAGDSHRYEMYDARIKTLQGQPVTLLCHVGWNNQSADSWECDLRDYNGSTR